MGGNRGARAPRVCRRCLPDTPDSLLHTMSSCSYTCDVATALLACVHQVVPGLPHLSALHLDLDLEPEQELPVVTLLATGYLCLWQCCKDAKPPTTARLKAELQVRCHTLGRTRKYSAAGDRLQVLLASLP